MVNTDLIELLGLFGGMEPIVSTEQAEREFRQVLSPNAAFEEEIDPPLSAVSCRTVHSRAGSRDLFAKHVLHGDPHRAYRCFVKVADIGTVLRITTGPIVVWSEQSNHHRPGVERRMLGLPCVVDSRFRAPKKTWQFLEHASMRMVRLRSASR